MPKHDLGVRQRLGCKKIEKKKKGKKERELKSQKFGAARNNGGGGGPNLSLMRQRHTCKKKCAQHRHRGNIARGCPFAEEDKDDDDDDDDP